MESDTVGEVKSVFESNLPLEGKLERARTELLDLSARNRLLNIPRSAKSGRTLEIVDEQSAEIFRLMIREQRAFTFLAGKSAGEAAEEEEEEGDEITELAQPEDDGTDERGIATRHADTKLQTRLTPAGLQKRLLDLYFDARTLEEEQGVNILFLALGTLKWIDPNNAANIRFAPLILIPASLERGNAAEKFKLRWRQEDFAPNLSLEAYLDRIHGIKMPMFEATDDFEPTSYFSAVAESVTAKAGWVVDPDHIVLGFFSFAKFLMYRDLDPAAWPAKSKLGDHPLIRSLVMDGFEAVDELISEDESIDARIAPSDMVHIVDSDSSQTLAVHEVRSGRNLVIQGPPGTGKSQTIANVIGSAIADGKTVLFVAEKMAALEVVKRRLDNTGVGDACLELHSNKANKRVLLEELRRTWELGVPKGESTAALNARLTEARDKLNLHATRMHEPLGSAGRTPYQVIGQLTRLRQSGQAPNDISLAGAEDWSEEEFRTRDVAVFELSERIDDISCPTDHIWCGVGIDTILPADVDRLIDRVKDLADRVEALQAEQAEIASALQISPAETLAELDATVALARRIAEAPDLEPEALGAQDWRNESSDIEALLTGGATYARCAAELASRVTTTAWATDVEAVRILLAPLPADFSLEGFGRIGGVAPLLPRLGDEARELAQALGLEPASSLGDAERHAAIGERVAVAPDASAEAFAAEVWDAGVERAGDLAEAVSVLETSRNQIGSRLNDAAWDVDLRQARAVLAAHGTGFFKIFSGEWRRTNRLVRSTLTSPKAPLDEVLELLDALGRGQAALSTIRTDDDFGRKAFGPDWRGERSTSRPLAAMVEWMRSLRGLGAEPRIIAARKPDQSYIRDRAIRVRNLLDEATPLLKGLWIDLGTSTSVLFGDTLSAERLEFAETAERLSDHAAADQLCRSIMTDVPDGLDDRRDRLTLLSEGQAALRQVEAGDDLGGTLFGSHWQALDTNWTDARESADWIRANLDIQEVAAAIPDRPGLLERAETQLTERAEFLNRLDALLFDLRISTADAMEADDARTTPVQDIAAKLRGWEAAKESLSKWVVYREQANRAGELGLGGLVERLHDGKLPPEAAVPNFEMSYYEAVFRDQVRLRPELAQFDGQLHNRLVRDFADLDRQRIAASSLQVVRAHHKSIPPLASGAVGPLGVLKGEIARRRGHMPIRKLMEKAAPAVQALKPVFMMSPLSVAQFLPPGGLTFDLLVMDEASQIQPVDALGAIARCRQVVVVGDPHQLPPTAFFAKMTGGTGEEEEDESGARVADIESILGLFTARGLPMRMLRWHYRSRHQSLIAVSNKQFYDNKLFIVPSPYTLEAGLGLRFHHIQNGIFESGATRTNPIEAKVVAQAIIAHARINPGQSLGVVAFSVAQRRAILDQLELLRRGLPPEQEAFFQAHPAEPFFVKNLENVQGDERDVIFISVGYGPTAPGLKPPMRFGPVGQEGGERRLNVLISRAKRRCEMFASMTDEDIEQDFASQRKGVLALKIFMHFARTGRMATAEISGRDHDSVFEEQVAQALHERGYQVHRQVGIAGFFIDLAISDPDSADRYLIGIECDGAAYHDARSARDRDRLRQAILEDHGWIIHRIWSTDWYQRPKEQLERTISAIEAAKVELGSRAARSGARAVPLEIITIERENVTEIGLAPIDQAAPAVRLYEEALLHKPDHIVTELHATPRGILSQLAEQVVEIESPVHVDEVINRIRDAWGLKRAGGRIQDAVERAIDVSVKTGRLFKDEDFLSWPGRTPQVRDRSQAKSPSIRRVDALPPAELEMAIVEIVRANFGATPEQIIQAVSRAVGFKATSSQLRELVEEVINDAATSRVLTLQNGVLVLGPDAPCASVEPPPLSSVEVLIAEGEGARLEFKQSIKFDVALKQPNKRIEESAVKTLAGFANNEGGTLLVGVADDGTVAGLEPDIACMGGNRDKMELQLNSLLMNHFGQAFRAAKLRVSFPEISGCLICRIDVAPATREVFVKIEDKRGTAAERFFVRSGNATQELLPSQIAPYVKERFR